MSRGHRHRRERDFWHAWREERRRLRDEGGGPPWEEGFPPPPPPHVAHAWREFFHRFTGEWPEHHWAFSGRRFSLWHQGVDSFNPFVANLLSKGGGLLPLIVLHLLAQKSRYGNEIMALITELTGGQWVANPGAIYPLMMELEELGLVSGQWEDPERRTIRIYSLTEAGAQELVRLRAILRPRLVEAIEILQHLVQDMENGEPDSAGGDESEER